MSCWKKNGLVPLGIVLLASSIQCLGLQLTEIVHTHSGPVQGEIIQTEWESKECAAFRGIPFAAPPVGPLRFKPPIEPTPWKAVRPAVNEGSECTQDTGPPPFNSTGSEDCLFINVYTPHTHFGKSANVEKKPVMVWIYGGAFSSGYSNVSVYGPDFFLEDDVVFVSFNYRVGAFGFLSANHADALGNTGLKDQAFALKWVRKNIANFGGDPNKVTIYGESAGGASVDYQVLSEMSQGLFQRAISMSGTPLAPWSHVNPAEAQKKAFDLARELGHETTDKDDLVRFLLTVPARDIITATKAITEIPLINLVFLPTTENSSIGRPGDHFLTECPLSKLQNGNFSKVDRMMGFTKNETLLFANRINVFSELVYYTESILRDIVEKLAGYNDKFADLMKILSEKTLLSVIKLSTSVLFHGPIDLTQRLVSARNEGKPVYYYRVSYESEFALHNFGAEIDLNGTAHADDVGYMFNVKMLKTPTEIDHPFNQFRKRFVKLWTDFAKFGNPTPQPLGENGQLGNQLWQDSGSAGWQFDIDEDFALKPRMVSRATEFYELLWLLANPIIIGCKNALNSVIDAL